MGVVEVVWVGGRGVVDVGGGGGWGGGWGGGVYWVMGVVGVG